MDRAEKAQRLLKIVKRLYVMQAFSDIEMATTGCGPNDDLQRPRRRTNWRQASMTMSRMGMADGGSTKTLRFGDSSSTCTKRWPSIWRRGVLHASDKQQPHVANAIQKLAAALRQPMTERLVQAGECCWRSRSSLSG